ncbi:surface antigen BspA-like [Trichomonas vaginalis G3]|uniref:Surface antigen BspA-like n=1 Tax=Trichomonas vaginalis (strain ATCC PRA-98 / G3) TaxID=412133 RepID=A2DX84_TRIV3|nr:amphoterin-induced protein family [Trichomonas vaginalis G3]EAY14966.1 surface antigen BspA-like [Trichomonas vaginalis G3]KAI5507361.1 amphoterin-induced protein family [Trichomonas vaginalis G3]|eukprot:XP_001327189.1 surface antigen BspA-like [Trichomonas vaginalis G3]
MNIYWALFMFGQSSKLTMSFTHKTLFSSNTLQKNANVSISYLNESDLIISTNRLIMNSNQTIIYEFWGRIFYDGITIPKTVKSIKERAFENSEIYNIDFEEDSQLTTIENYAFRNCSNLKSFIFSLPGLSKIGIESFKNCSQLTSIIFESAIIDVMNNAFENCVKLLNVSGILNIPDNCFSGCTNLEIVNILDNSRFIGSKSFENCYSLENISIPSSVQFISEYSFLNCVGLKSIILIAENDIKKISNNSFAGCISLQNISNFESANCKCIDNTLYYKNKTCEYLAFHLNHSLDKALIINCNVICSYSFNECNNICNITILPNSVSLIEKYSFNNCLNLQHINFPLSVEAVESFSFNECHSICCPLIIENTKLDYIRMIIYSGIPRHLILSCEVIHDTRNFETPYCYGNGLTAFLLTWYK